MDDVSELTIPKQRKQKPVEEDLPRDPTERKRVLNVLAQRRYRRRKKEQQAQLEGFLQALNGSHAVLSPRTGLHNRQNGEMAADSSSRGKVLDLEKNSDTFAVDETMSSHSYHDSSSSTRSTSTGVEFSSLSSQIDSGMSDLEIDSLLNLPTDSRTSNEGIGESSPQSFQHQIGWTSDLSQDASEDFAFQLSSFLQDDDVQNTTFADDFIVTVPELDLLRAARTIAIRLNSGERIFGANANSIFVEAPNSVDWASLPQNLQPTAAQLTIPHHPVLDLLPWPKVRTKLINLFSTPADTWPKHPQDQSVMTPFRLVCDMEDDGIRVYGEDPTTESSWEVQQSFFDAWWWALDHGVIHLSNQRKKSKGDLPLKMGYVST